MGGAGEGKREAGWLDATNRVEVEWVVVGEGLLDSRGGTHW